MSRNREEVIDKESSADEDAALPSSAENEVQKQLRDVDVLRRSEQILSLTEDFALDDEEGSSALQETTAAAAASSQASETPRKKKKKKSKKKRGQPKTDQAEDVLPSEPAQASSSSPASLMAANASIGTAATTNNSPTDGEKKKKSKAKRTASRSSSSSSTAAATISMTGSISEKRKRVKDRRNNNDNESVDSKTHLRTIAPSPPMADVDSDLHRRNVVQKIQNYTSSEIARDASMPGATRIHGANTLDTSDMNDDNHEIRSVIPAHPDVAFTNAVPTTTAKAAHRNQAEVSAEDPQSGTAEPQTISVADAVTKGDLESQIRNDILSSAVVATEVHSAASVGAAGHDEEWSRVNVPRKAKTRRSSDNNEPAEVSCSYLRLIIAGLFCLVAIIGAVVLALVLVGDSGDGGSSSSTAINGQSNSTDMDTPVNLQFLEWLKEQTFGSDILSDTESPQYAAFEWLANEIESADDIPSPDDDDPNNSKATVLVERYAMACLYYSLGGSDWSRNSDWLTEKSICDWQQARNQAERLFCNGSTGRLISLLLQDNNMVGAVPPEIGLLEKLEVIRIDDNQLNRLNEDGPADLFSFGGVPTTIGLLTDLTIFQASGTGIGGRIPTELGNLGLSLTRFIIHDAGLIGTLPTELGKLTELEVLRLRQNLLTGVLPSELGNLGKLDVFNLAGNKFEGAIPVEFTTGWPASMKLLYLQGNDFDGDAITNTFCRDDAASPAVDFAATCSITACSCCTDCCSSEQNDDECNKD